MIPYLCCFFDAQNLSVENNVLSNLESRRVFAFSPQFYCRIIQNVHRTVGTSHSYKLVLNLWSDKSCGRRNGHLSERVGASERPVNYCTKRAT